MANAPVAQPVSSLSSGMVSHIQNNINSILGNAQDPNPGQTLQHYVSQFQDDPTHYAPVLAMASATQNHLNTQKQLQQSPQRPQPPVAQQAFAQLGQPAPQPQPPQAQQPAPQGAQNGAENSGIGQLPAGNIASMAGGGITGMPSFAGGSGSYVDPAQASMVSNITPDQAMAMGYQNPLYSYGANDQHGSIEGVPMKEGGRVEGGVRRFDVAGQVTDWNAPVSDTDLARARQGLAGLAPDPTKGPLFDRMLPPSTAAQAQSAPMPANPGWQGLLGGSTAPQIKNVATGAAQQNAGTQPPLASAQAANDMIKNYGLPSIAPQGQPDISAVNPAFTHGQEATAQNAQAAAKVGAGFNSNSASAQAIMEKALGNPVNQQQLDLKYQTDEIRSAMLANGVDPDMSKQFKTLQDRQDASDTMLDKKQNLAIMQAGLGMIKSGNPWEAIASGATQGTKAYSDALDQYQQQQQHLADSRMALDQSKQSLAAGMVDKGLGQVDQATKYMYDYHAKTAEGIVSLMNNQATNAATLQHAGIMAGAQKYSADQMFGARTYGADARAGSATSVAADRNYANFINNYMKNTPGANPQMAHAQAIMSGIYPSSMSPTGFSDTPVGTVRQQ